MGVLAASSVVRWRLCRSHIFIALYLAPRLVCVPAGVGAVECDRLDAPASLSEGVHSSGRLFCVIVHRLSLDWGLPCMDRSGKRRLRLGVLPFWWSA